jgi:PAS domain-containing protein
MDLLERSARLMSEGSGSFFYHVVLLLILAGAIGLAWSEWRRQKDQAVRQMFTGLAVMAAMRIVLLVATALAATGVIPHTVLVPPAERMVDTVSLALIAWAFVPVEYPRRAIWGPALLTAMALPLLAAPVLILLWQGDVSLQPGLNYADTWQANVWSAWQLVYLALAGVAAWPGRSPNGAKAQGTRHFYTLLIALDVLAAGRITELLLPAATAHVAMWERFSNMVGYPMVLVAVYQSIVVEIHDYSRQLEDISQASLEQIKSLLALFDTSQAMTASLDLDTIVESATEGIVRVLKADQCAIAFSEESNPNQMRLSAIHNPERRGKGEAVTFPLDYQLAVRQALRRKKPVVLETALDNVQLKVLYALLGSREIGPLLVQPLVADDSAIGALIVGNGRSKRPFTPNDVKLCQSLADRVAVAIVNAREYQSVRLQLELARQELAEQRTGSSEAQQTVTVLTQRSEHHQAEFERLRRRFEEIQEERNALEVQFASIRAETDRLRELLNEMESELVQAHANLDAQSRWHRAEIARLHEEHQALQQETNDLRSLFESFTIGVIEVDALGYVRAANAAALTLLGRPDDSLQGELARNLVPDGRWQVVVQRAQGGQGARVTLPVAGRHVLVDTIAQPGTPGEDGAAESKPGLAIVLQDLAHEPSSGQAHRADDAWVSRDMSPRMADASDASRASESEGRAGE